MVKYDKNYRSSRTTYSKGTGGRSRLPGGGVGKGLAGAGGIGGIILLIITMLTGGGGGGLGGLAGLEGSQASPASGGATAEEASVPRNAFLEFVFDHNQEVWNDIFADAGLEYEYATFRIFEEAVATGGCGNAPSAVGPFYCPADNQVYLDQGFFDELSTRFGAPGDFAAAYVVAHEVGHHVQNVLGLSAQTRQAQQQDPRNANQYSINLELQADCLAGVWAFVAARDTVEIEGEGEVAILEPGDIAEGLGAAAAVGDDRIQESAGARVNPESWTHGSSQQRVEEFEVGYTTGDPVQCDTVSFD